MDRENVQVLIKVNIKQLTADLTILFLVAFLVRLFFIMFGDQNLVYDEPYYDHIARNIASGRGFTFNFSAWFTSIPGQPTSVQEPVYPLFLATLKILFGKDNYLAERIFQAFLGALVPVLGGVLGIRNFGLRTGVTTAILLALYPPLIYFGRFLMTEIVFIFLLMCAFLLASCQRPSAKVSCVLTGLTFGLACLTRSMLLGMLPVFLLVLWLMNGARQKRIGPILLTLAGVLATVAPWTIRNYIVHGTFVPITTKAGWNLYFYNYPVSNYDFNYRWDEVPVPDLSDLSEVDREREYTNRAIGFMKEYPGLMTSFAFAKLIDFWNPLLKGENRSLSLINIFSYGVLTIFALVGLARHIKHKNLCPIALLMWLTIGFYMVNAMVFTGGGKFRLPVEPMLVVLGSEVLQLLLLRFQTQLHVFIQVINQKRKLHAHASKTH